MNRQTSTPPIVAVLLSEDRALVTRRISVDLLEGKNTLIIEGLTPVLVDKSVAVDVCHHRENLEVLDFRIQRERLLPVPASELTLKSLRQKLAEGEHLCRSLSSSRQAYLNYSRHNLWSELAQRAAWNLEDPSTWQEQISLLEKELEDNRIALGQCQKEQLRLRARLSQLEVGEELPVDKSALCSLNMELLARSSGTFTLQVLYAVPGACWRPYHRASLNEDSLNFTTQACLWQNTGEDWSEVELSLSTEQQMAVTKAPRLVADVLSLGLPVTRDLVTREVEAETLEGSSRLVTQVPGIDDQGEAFVFTAPAKVSLKSDGQPFRLDLFSFVSSSKMSRQARPEQLQACFLESWQNNLSGRALLSGPVDLVRAGRVLGRTWIDFVAPNESFQLIWGIENTVSVGRRESKHKEDSSIMSSWVSTKIEVEVFLSNLGAQPLALELVERIPVSESAELTVEVHQTGTYQAKLPDENGFVRWQIDLTAGENLKVLLTYFLKVKKTSQLG